MGLFDYFKASRNTATVARDRLNILIAHERAQADQPSYLPALQQDLLDVIRKYVDIGDDDLKLVIDRDDDCEILELNVTLPEAVT
ncbi:MAG: cell division topological specificity factor MinE [Methylococcales bacterium]|jgi:cell division topological specificity factor|nr:cell division topological specificity factor MinE [Methylococcales bacterium]MBT7444385.1 cell division topological specificity factor MinE [Methylococcales bacterium]